MYMRSIHAQDHSYAKRVQKFTEPAAAALFIQRRRDCGGLMISYLRYVRANARQCRARQFAYVRALRDNCYPKGIASRVSRNIH